LSSPQGYTLVCRPFHFVILKFIYLNANTKYIKYFNAINLVLIFSIVYFLISYSLE